MPRALLVMLALLASACTAAPPPPPEPPCGEQYPCDGMSCAGVFRPAPPPPPEDPAALAREPLWLDAPLTLGGVMFKHAFPTEQRRNTPVPFYFEPPSEVDFHSVVLRHKMFGMAHYRGIPMLLLGAGLAAEIPCQDVDTTGPLRYMVQLLDSEGHAIFSLGTPVEPLVVQIKESRTGGPPALPGRKPPRPCADPEVPLVHVR